MSASVERITRIPNPNEAIPWVAGPTLALFLGGVIVYEISTILGVTGSWPWELSTAVNAIAVFAIFTVTHETSHAAASAHEGFNRWLGRLSFPFVTPIGSYYTFRFIHMQHHLHTNEVDGTDPDHFAHHGVLPLRWLMWLTIDVQYLRFYLARIRPRPIREKVEMTVSFILVAGVLSALVATGHGFEVLVYYAIPARLAMFILGWTFVWLPHQGLSHTNESDRYKTTRNIIGRERLLTPLLLYQNYHLVHHLHPVVPFYRYIAVWRRNEAAYLDHDPPLADPRGRPLTAEEVRRLRALDEHHH